MDPVEPHVGPARQRELLRLRVDGGRPLAEIAERHGATPAQIALAWLVGRSPTMLPIPGTLSLEHLKRNLGALEIELSDAEFDALR